MYRTNNCGVLRLKDVGKNVIMSGWIKKIRNLGSIIFIDLRDMYGITQLNLINYFNNKKKINNLGREFVIKVEGKVIERLSKNFKNPTGEIEILVKKLKILNNSLVPPFKIENNTDVNEDIRMKYRYLDIRRDIIKNNIRLRHNLYIEIRNFFLKENFLEIETPILINPTTDGARNFYVPYRKKPGFFYSLSQSPQLFKQLLMIGGIDKYFQIVKCFRDEDFRSDRQPEFTQIDCEMSFVDENDILNIFEKFIHFLLKKIKGINLNKFPILTYEEAMNKYGSDKPDIRFDMKLFELNDFSNKKEYIMGISLPVCFNYKIIEEIFFFFKKKKIKQLIWIKYLKKDKFQSSIEININLIKNWAKRINSKCGDLLIILLGEKNIIVKNLGLFRIEMSKRLNLIKNKIFSPLWIINFPYFKWNKEKSCYNSLHHPFTSPEIIDIKFLKENPEKIKSKSYDLVINGKEIGGGSIRINNSKIQKIIFNHLGFSKKKIEKEFGFLIKSFKYGAPPHGGIAFGLDRLISVFAYKDNIRDFIAFPKGQDGKDLMIESPSNIEEKELKNNKLNFI
uniref:aspartate--tRNA ligase n=1 Tax=Candidatus Karelsulcia muelleri TaxID=336810 RepID=UPI0032B2AB88